MLYLVNPYLSGSQYELDEWEIYGTGASPVPSTNVALGKPGLALNQLPGYEAGKAFDGDLNTEWRSATAAPVWIYVDLGHRDGYREGRAALVGRHACHRLCPVCLETGLPGAFYAQHAGVGGDETAIFYPLRTRYVMLNALRGVGPTIGLREFEVFSRGGSGGGPPIPTATPPIPPPPPIRC